MQNKYLFLTPLILHIGVGVCCVLFLIENTEMYLFFSFILIFKTIET